MSPTELLSTFASRQPRALCVRADIYYAQLVLSTIREILQREREGLNKHARREILRPGGFCVEYSARQRALKHFKRVALFPPGIKDSNQFSRWDISAALVRGDPRVYSVAPKIYSLNDMVGVLPRPVLYRAGRDRPFSHSGLRALA